MPKRIQRKRTRSWKMPDGAVYVGRPTKWGNPFRVCLGDPAYAVLQFGFWVERLESFPRVELPPSIDEIQAELRGKDLACWCKIGAPCHADVLLELANTTEGA